MKRAGKLCFILLLTVSSITGCWNLREPDQLAFDLGTGMDLTKDGKMELSTLIAIPAGVGGGGDGGGGGGTKKKSFIVVSATGKDIYDAIQNIQRRLSRKVFLGHRQIIIVGQRMAEHGIGNLLDEFIRNPDSEMRSRKYVVKDGKAKDVLSIDPIFDTFITDALAREESTLGLKHYYHRDFYSDALSQGTQPLLPAVRLNAASKKYVYAGTGIFNKDDGLKLVGFLNVEETSYANWITGRQTGFAVTSFVTHGNGYVSLKLQSLGQRIRVKMVDKQLQIDVRLTGKGTIVENNADLDPSKSKDLQIIQDELNQTTQKSIQQLIKKAQKQYKTDIFGFGERVHEQYPHQWKNTLNQNWNKTFPQLPISVKVELLCKDPGQSNSSTRRMP
jgi:spore germination protein KC